MKKYFLPLLFTPLFLWGDFDVATRVDIHGKYQNLVSDYQAYVLYGRIDKAIGLPKKWDLFLRLDVPYIWLWGKETVMIEVLEEEGIVDDIMLQRKKRVPKTQFLDTRGISDLITKFFFSSPPFGDWKFGFGSELFFPTAQREEIGTGKYCLRPMVGVKYSIPHIASWTAFFAKYFFSFAGDRNRPTLKILSLQPIWVITFFKTFLLSIAPEAQLNVKTRQWFLPVGATVGAVWDRFYAGIEYDKGIITDFPVYKDNLEVTLTYFF